MGRFLFVISLAILIPLPLGAEQLTFQGRVLDPALAPVAGARVTATPDGPGSPISTVTGRNGEFRLSLQPRVYTMAIASDGFAEISARVTAAALIGQWREFVLQISGVAETVRVSAQMGDGASAVASATKVATPLRDIPQSISVVSSAMIADQRMQSMADVVRYMPGVGMAQGEGNRDTPILRGNSSTSDFFVDGVRDDAQYLRDTYNVDHVEALKGPNAMIFGRGGGGGVINRVTRQATWAPSRQIDLQLGSWANRRLTADIGGAPASSLSTRVTGVYERSDSYRAGVDVERLGINPTVAFVLGPNTMVRAGYEYFRDTRTADRGVSSVGGRPVATDASTFFGDPGRSTSDASVHMASVVAEHNLGHGISVRSRTTFATYAKYYANVFPGAVDADAGVVALSAYDHSTDRRNVFNQTDLVVSRRTGSVAHVIVGGVEIGRQSTGNFRRTGFFSSIGRGVRSTSVPLESPTVSVPVEFRQAPADADNTGVATVAAVYLQDQLSLSKRLQAVVGLRFDRFVVNFRNNRTAAELASHDGLLSPRLGLIYAPSSPVSVYVSYSLAHLPRAGDQLGSLSLSNQALDPEVFHNYELGAKWDISSALSLSAAAYRLDRGNIAVADPVDPARSFLVDGQRTQGLEAGLDGRITRGWRIAGGYAFQNGRITQSLSPAAKAGAVLAQLPKHSFSLWNKFDVSPRWGVGVGVIHRQVMFASTDNQVVLPGFVRVDTAVFWNISDRLRAQLNVENILDESYYASAHNNHNILPGSPRAVRVGFTVRF